MSDVEIVSRAAIVLIDRAVRRHYPVAALSQLVTINNGQGLKSEDRDNSGNCDVFGSGGRVGQHTAKMHDGPFVVIGRKGSAGKVTFAAQGGWVTDTAYFATPLNPLDLHCKFLFYGLKALDFTANIISTAIPGINRTAIYRYSLPLPPPEVQIGVVQFLDAVMDGKSGLMLPELPAPLTDQRRIVARIEELAAQIQEARALTQETTGAATAFVTSLNSHLAGNRIKKLGEILELHEKSEPIVPTGSYPQVGIRSFGGGLFPKGPVEGTATTYRAFNRLYDGALLLSQVKGWEGAVAVCPPELVGWYASPEYRTFRVIPSEARPEYLRALVKTEWFWSKLAGATRGVGARRERTRPEQFLDIELPFPTVEKQLLGEKMFRQISYVQKLQNETAAELNALLPSILDKAFKGEL